jgi:hypothetical protein
LKANVNFYKNHAAELQKLEALNQHDDCDDDSGEDDETE